MYLFFYKTNKKTALNRRFFVTSSILQGVIPRHSERNKVKSKNLNEQCANPTGPLDTLATTHHCHPVRGQSPKVCTPHCKFFKNCAKRSRRVPPTKATTRRDSSRSFGMTVGARNDIIIKFGMTNTVILSETK